MRTEEAAKPGEQEPDLCSHLNQLQDLVDQLGTASIDDVGMYGCMLRAALVKSFEFALVASAEEPLPHTFFLTSTLRGICEDLIALTFISRLEPDDRDEALAHLMAANIREGIESQSEFFEEVRPWQPVLKPNDKPNVSTDKELRALAKKLGWSGRKPWPSVWYMAKSEGLETLYRYLYSATSKWVHFSPQVLLRMGWGGSKDDIGNHTKWKFTTSHFVKYYAEFNRVYSTMLLAKLFKGPADEIIPKEAVANVDGIEHCIDQILRWPEAVTFEELNVSGPNPFVRIALKVAHESKEKDDEVSEGGV
ncbi:hypothetical protein HFP89_00360 [Wenzhouxiangella sp. XN79A]|uniref:DUF5677 domain-containing protein n=1 Tax=Wenzhouxiangella sp. XN79A TaxID=2724193 RepID=UPI00144AB670|nr:DUF5677 domain-containing protein [Wenzhouxiangella sp. XN79A]NKI33615.1 hypothetical protein [Wenzhouxiangella sp. XN79A]